MEFWILENVGDNFCSDENIINGLKIVGYLLFIAKLFVPLIIIGMGILDIYKTVIEGSSESLTKQLKSLGFRIVIGLFIFFLPTLINLVLNALPGYTDDMKDCQTVLLDPFSA